MSVIDFLISKLAPYDCLGCGNEGNIICENCAAKNLRTIPERCYRCRKVTSAARTCRVCRRVSKLYAVRVGVVYDDLAKELVWHLKFKGAQAVAAEMSKRMHSIDTEAVSIVPVPTATSRVRRRGYDQARLLARELARLNHIPYLDCLARRGQSHQVGASRRERLRQLDSAFRVSRPMRIKGVHVLLVDDVVTTGATLEAAATVLRKAGAKRIEAVVFAQP